MSGDKQQGFGKSESACSYCGSQMALTSPLCLICGMPRPQSEFGAKRISTPAPKLMAVQKAFDPNAQQYSAVLEEARVPAPPPGFDAPLFGGNSMPFGESPRKTAWISIRALAGLLAIAAVGAAVIFGSVKAWHSKTILVADLAKVRTELHDLSQSYRAAIPRYTATRMPKFHTAKPAAIEELAQPQATPGMPAPALGVRILPTSPAPPPNRPGNVQIRIASDPVASGLLPVSM
jgi:hypothetical protein